MATTNKGLNQPALNSTNWDVPINANFGYLDAALGGSTSISVTGVGITPQTLTLTQYQSLLISFTGTLSSNVTYQVPSGVGGQWVIYNNTTGAHTLTVRTAAAGASVAILQGERRLVYSDGTGVYTAESGANFAGSSGQIAYGGGASLVGSAGLTYDGTKVSVTSTTATTNAATEALRLNSQSSGTPAAGIGAAMTFAAETAAGVTKDGMQISTVATDVTSGSEDFDFVLKLMAAGAAAAEMLRVSSTGVMTLNGGNVIAGRTSTNTDVQSLAYAGITATADDDGTFSSGTYTPTPVGGNFKAITNGGAFTIAAPTAAGDYTVIIQITNGATAGAITLSGFNKTAGDPFTTTSGDDFFAFITKCNGFKSVYVQALQ